MYEFKPTKKDKKDKTITDMDVVRQATTAAVRIAHAKMNKQKYVVFTDFYYGKQHTQKMWVGMPKDEWQCNFSDCPMREMQLTHNER